MFSGKYEHSDTITILKVESEHKSIFQQLKNSVIIDSYSYYKDYTESADALIQTIENRFKSSSFSSYLKSQIANTKEKIKKYPNWLNNYFEKSGFGKSKIVSYKFIFKENNFKQVSSTVIYKNYEN